MTLKNNTCMYYILRKIIELIKNDIEYSVKHCVNI